MIQKSSRTKPQVVHRDKLKLFHPMDPAWRQPQPMAGIANGNPPRDVPRDTDPAPTSRPRRTIRLPSRYDDHIVQVNSIRVLLADTNLVCCSPVDSKNPATVLVEPVDPAYPRYRPRSPTFGWPQLRDDDLRTAAYAAVERMPPSMDSFSVLDVFRRGWNCSYTVADDLATYTKYVMEATLRRAQITLGGPVIPPPPQPATKSPTAETRQLDDPSFRPIFRTVVNDHYQSTSKSTTTPLLASVTARPLPATRLNQNITNESRDDRTGRRRRHCAGQSVREYRLARQYQFQLRQQRRREARNNSERQRAERPRSNNQLQPQRQRPWNASISPELLRQLPSSAAICKTRGSESLAVCRCARAALCAAPAAISV